MSNVSDMKSTNQLSFFWRHIGPIFSVPLLLGLAAIFLVEFLPSRTWGLVSGALTLVATLAFLPQIFSERARTVIDRSRNPALLRKGQWTLGIGGMALIWVFSWLALCQLGGSVITYAIGVPHSETVGAVLGVKSRRFIGCRYYARLTDHPDRWGNEICVSSFFYANRPLPSTTLRLHGTLSPMGFKVKSFER
jgi:hypothetical protein